MKTYKDLKTFEDACKVEGLDPEKVIPNFSVYPEKNRKTLIAHAKLVIIVSAANKLDNNNKEWTPNWNDSSEYKYEPWFNMSDGSSASGFSFYDFDRWRANSIVGSRLCFKSSDAVEYITKQFIELYREYFTN